jgi:hypothetical protein
MSTSATGKQHGRGQHGALPFYAAGCYAIPIRFLYGTAAEINFWDIVYFHAREAGGDFDTSTKELVEQTGFSRQMVGRLHRQAVERGELVEDVSWISGRRFILRVPGFDQLTKGVVWKPLGYVRNGWHRVVTPAIPKRVLNLYLQQPRQQVYCLNPRYIAAKCKRRFPGGKAQSAAPLNSADVSKALRLLMRLGLLVPEGDGFRIDWNTFNQPAPATIPSFDAPDPCESSLFCKAAAVDRSRAERALELLNTGHYRMETHFSDIFRDLAYVRGDDYPSLKAKVYRRRNRPPGLNRWRNTWRAFQYELKRRITEIQGPKCILYLGEATSFACSLTLDLDQITQRVLAVRLVGRAEWPWHLEANPSDLAVRLELHLDNQVLFARTINVGDAEVRHMLHPDEWPDPTASLTLVAQCARPLPGVHVEAWLEARLRR